MNQYVHDDHWGRDAMPIHLQEDDRVMDTGPSPSPSPPGISGIASPPPQYNTAGKYYPKSSHPNDIPECVYSVFESDIPECEFSVFDIPDSDCIHIGIPAHAVNYYANSVMESDPDPSVIAFDSEKLRAAKNITYLEVCQKYLGDQDDETNDDFKKINLRKEINEYQTIMIRSGLGSGKTTCVSSLLERILRGFGNKWNPDIRRGFHTHEGSNDISALDVSPSKHMRILVIVYRIILGQFFKEMWEEHDFKLYSDIKKRAIDSEEYPHLICQIDSIGRIQGEYDIVICDEWNGITTHLSKAIRNQYKVTKDSHGIPYTDFLTKRDQVWKTFIKALEEAPRVLALDGFLDNLAVDVLGEIRKKRNSTLFINNTFKAYEGHEIHRIGWHCMLAKMKEDLDAGHKIVMPCGLRKLMDGAQLFLTQSCVRKDLKFLCIDKLNCKEELMQPKYWHNHDAVFYSPAVSVGVSENSGLFHRRYSMLHNTMSCNAEQAKQMWHRVRNTHETVNYMFIDSWDMSDHVSKYPLTDRGIIFNMHRYYTLALDTLKKIDNKRYYRHCLERAWIHTQKLLKVSPFLKLKIAAEKKDNMTVMHLYERFKAYMAVAGITVKDKRESFDDTIVIDNNTDYEMDYFKERITQVYGECHKVLVKIMNCEMGANAEYDEIVAWQNCEDEEIKSGLPIIPDREAADLRFRRVMQHQKYREERICPQLPFSADTNRKIIGAYVHCDATQGTAEYDRILHVALSLAEKSIHFNANDKDLTIQNRIKKLVCLYHSPFPNPTRFGELMSRPRTDEEKFEELNYYYLHAYCGENLSKVDYLLFENREELNKICERVNNARYQSYGFDPNIKISVHDHEPITDPESKEESISIIDSKIIDAINTLKNCDILVTEQNGDLRPSQKILVDTQDVVKFGEHSKRYIHQFIRYSMYKMCPIPWETHTRLPPQDTSVDEAWVTQEMVDFYDKYKNILITVHPMKPTRKDIKEKKAEGVVGEWWLKQSGWKWNVKWLNHNVFKYMNIKIETKKSTETINGKRVRKNKYAFVPIKFGKLYTADMKDDSPDQALREIDPVVFWKKVDRVMNESKKETEAPSTHKKFKGSQMMQQLMSPAWQNALYEQFKHPRVDTVGMTERRVNKLKTKFNVQVGKAKKKALVRQTIDENFDVLQRKVTHDEKKYRERVTKYRTDQLDEEDMSDYSSMNNNDENDTIPSFTIPITGNVFGPRWTDEQFDPFAQRRADEASGALERMISMNLLGGNESGSESESDGNDVTMDLNTRIEIENARVDSNHDSDDEVVMNMPQWCGNRVGNGVMDVD